jgi:Flp pilus assembly pilin Flp
MNTVKTFVTRLFKDVSGAGMVEYALLVALIGVLLIGTLLALTGGISNALGVATTALGTGTAATNPLP